MINFLKMNSVSIISKKLKLLYILNVLDIIFTLILLKTGLFKEVNGFMVNAVNNTPILSLLIKIVFVGALILFLLNRIQDATQQQLKIANYLIVGILAFYCAIIISHIWYFCILLSIKLII